MTEQAKKPTAGKSGKQATPAKPAAPADPPAVGKRNVTDQRRMERREEKGDGRNRRAEMLMDKQAQEKARHDAFEVRMNNLESRLATVEEQIATLIGD